MDNNNNLEQVDTEMSNDNSNLEQELFTFRIGEVNCKFMNMSRDNEDYYIDFDKPIYYNNDTKITTKYIDYFSAPAFTYLLEENKRLKEASELCGISKCKYCNDWVDFENHECG